MRLKKSSLFVIYLQILCSLRYYLVILGKLNTHFEQISKVNISFLLYTVGILSLLQANASFPTLFNYNSKLVLFFLLDNHPFR